MSARTLSRRLQDEGSTLPRLRAEVGCDYAVTLLRETDKTIAQIAAITGFQDAAAFTRAFKRCRGRQCRAGCARWWGAGFGGNNGVRPRDHARRKRRHEPAFGRAG